MLHRQEIKNYRRNLLLLVVIAWSVIFGFSSGHWQLLSEYGYFFLLGLTGAIVANSTGAGGGIIFIPFFSALSIGGVESLGTSILIQCFGMTAGTVSWLTTSHIAQIRSAHLSRLVTQLLIICGLACIAGVLTGQYVLANRDPAMMQLVFRLFSVSFGLILLVVVYFNKRTLHTHFRLLEADMVLLVVASFVGGIITAWISVGIGEIIAIILILRKYPTMVAIAIGVAMSSLAVLTAAYEHIFILESVVWSVVLFAVPGAILGGTFAYKLSEKLGPHRLKVFFACWILLAGLCM